MAPPASTGQTAVADHGSEDGALVILNWPFPPEFIFFDFASAPANTNRYNPSLYFFEPVVNTSCLDDRFRDSQEMIGDRKR